MPRLTALPAPGVASAFGRTLAALFVGYMLTMAFTAAFSLALHRGLGWSRAEALAAASMPAFLVLLAAALRAYSVSARRAWAEGLMATLLLAALAGWLIR